MNHDEWLFSEMTLIDKENRLNKKNNKLDNKIMYKLLCLLIPLLFFAVTLPAEEYKQKATPLGYSKDEGVSWKCKSCNKRVWSNQKDWAGRYQCSCGAYKE